MGTYAPYGYIKDPADHNHLLIDDKVAHVVREIFELALEGNGISKIRKHINKQHILRPAAYAAEQGATGYERYFEDNEENRYIWSENSVRGILRSPIYAGNLAGYKRIAANMKSKKRPSKLPEEWEVIPDTHEGIVTQEEFDTVQQLITSRRLPENKGGFENIFAGVIKCADCGYALRAISKYCPACAKRIQREKSNESKRRSRARDRQVCIELSAKNDRLIWHSEKGGSSARATRTRWSMFTAM